MVRTIVAASTAYRLASSLEDRKKVSSGFSRIKRSSFRRLGFSFSPAAANRFSSTLGPCRTSPEARSAFEKRIRFDCVRHKPLKKTEPATEHPEYELSEYNDCCTMSSVFNICCMRRDLEMRTGREGSRRRMAENNVRG